MNINHVDIFLKGAKDKATPKEFSLSVIHIFPDCSPNLKKGLRDEFMGAARLIATRLSSERRIHCKDSMEAASMWRLSWG